MIRPNFTITKKIIISRHGHYRYYSHLLTYEMWKRLKKHQRPKAVTITLDPNDNRYLNISHIQTEKQLCRFLFEKIGAGEYRLIGHIKGRQGGWTFWKGEITDEGFCFETRQRSNIREINALKKELTETNDPELIRVIHEELELEKEVSFSSKFGFYPYLKPSGRRGDFVTWSEPDVQEEIKPLTDEIW